ncbi:hypothetical protein INR49_015867 [Caranx melampygus]|nr:hypothetical protein INR49_015867 [Caranx melampygus]
MRCCCGLLTAQKKPVPLKSIKVELEVRDHVATVVSTLDYENKEDKPIEAVFVFPLPGDAAVCHFSAKIGQTEVVAEVKEKQQAREEYDDALSSGQQAFMLEESEQSPDIFTLSVGSLPPGESASIRLEYVTELAVQADDGLRFCLPAVLNPRYQPQGSEGASVQVTSVPASLVPYNLSFSARVSSPRPVSKVESNCSLDPVQYLNTEQTQATVKLAAGHKFDRDVELLIYYKDAHQPTAVVEAGQASAKSVVMLSLYPEFPQSVMSSVTSSGEFVFLMDRSGSMDDSYYKVQGASRIASARDTLLLLLKSLPMGCYFNIYSFGSSFEHMFPCFSFGIGEGASSALINGIAKEGGGHAQFITGKDRMQPKVMQSLRFALQPTVKDISVMWDLPKGVSVTVLSPPITTLFQGQRLTVHRLGARTMICSLELEESKHRGQQDGGVKEKVVKLSVQSGVSSSYTAFIAVAKGSGEPIQGPLVRRNVPTPIIFGAHSQGMALPMGNLVFRLMKMGCAPKARGSKVLCDEETEGTAPKQPVRDPLLQVVSLQMASGCWLLDPGLAAALGKTSEEVDKAKPASANQEVWATTLALIWLHAFKLDAKEEWELLAMKAASWLRAQNVPLKSIEVELEVRDHVATVVSTLNYENKEDKPIEAVFVFPLPGDAAVCHFSAKIGQTEVVAEVKEKQQAREEYDDALSSGQQAFMLEESEQSPDIFTLSVGSLPPGESASIRLEYVTELAVQADDGLRFCLPAVLNPRYQPQGSEGASVQVTSVPASLVPYNLSFSARVSSSRPVSKVESNCSLDPVQYLNTEQTQATVKLAAGHKFDRDVELLIYYKDAHQPTAVVEAGQASAKSGTLMGDPVVMLSLYPEFPQSVMSSVTSSGEFVFLLDRSGSMDDSYYGVQGASRIASARDTLLLLLKSLPMGCYFNIYSFGSRFEHMFPESVEYTQSSMEEAVKKVETMEADLGGTEILRPLQHIYSQPCIPSQPRQLFVFTDGEVSNTKEVIHLVKKNSGSHRCFSFGIGEGASSALINGIAEEGGGHAQFITGKDRLQSKVMQSLRFALQPAVKDISVTWDLPKGVSVTVLSPPITTIFQGQRSLIYAQLTGQSPEASEGSAMVKYSLAGHHSEDRLHFSLKPAEDTGLTIHRLGARTLIRSLEMEEREHSGQQDGGVKEKMVSLSVQSGVSSCYTAFIAVNKGSGEPIQGPLVRRNIPTANAGSSASSGSVYGSTRIEVELEVRDHVATVVSTLNYENKEDKPIEAVFVFPLPGDAAVCHFSAKIGQTEVVAEVKEKQQVREEYDDALSSGRQAFMLEESEQSPDIFTLSVGSLPPGESASIRLEYVTELAVQADDGLRFCLPAVLNPRYQPQGSEGGDSQGASVQVTSVPASLVPYTLCFSARVSSPRPVSKVESNCALDPIQYLNTEQTQAMVKLAARHKFDRDVELLIYYKDAHQPTAVVEAGQASAKSGTLMGDPVVMLSLYPEFPQSVMSSVTSSGEFVFLMDRSGSMDDRCSKYQGASRIASARDTLLLLLKSLPMGCYFNIYSFGKSVEYSQSSMEEAVKTVETMEADLGGTEILKPLQHIYSQPCIPSQPRQVFVFTDGEVSNTKEVINLVKKNSGSHRCFSFGIGEGASSALINGIAKEGGGHAQFITGMDRLQPKVMQSLRFALQPAVNDISVKWDLPRGVSVTVLSPPITRLFQGQRSLIYAQLNGQHRGQRDGRVKEKVVKLSVQSGVSSCYTAFIAVNKGSGEPIQGPLVRRNVPTAMMSDLEPRSAVPKQPVRDPLLQDTLLLLLKSLPMGCYLNVYSFGSRFEHIFPKSVEYCEKTLEEAVTKVEKMGADLGGTEILECFSFGIGEGASSALINGIAKEGRGHAQFITGNDRMQPKVMQSLRFALQPAVEDVSVTWDLPKGVSVTVLSPPITTIFQGQRSLIYAQLTGQSEASEGCVTVKYTLAGHSSESKLRFSLKPAEDTGLTVHRLGARTVIRSLEVEERDYEEVPKQDEGVREKVVELSVQSGVSSSYTAFIAVNKMLCAAQCSMMIPTCSAVCFDDPSAGFEEGQAEPPNTEKPRKDPLLQLVSLQKASGYWLLDPALAAVLGKTSEEVDKAKPSAANQEVWATTLALIWLHAFKLDAKEEWELLAVKAASWLRAQNTPCVAECVDAGNALLGCEV